LVIFIAALFPGIAVEREERTKVITADQMKGASGSL
jgi:hypothetical protein